MQKLAQSQLTDKRNSSIELLKLFAIFMIVINHVVQSLHCPNEYMMNQDYVLDITVATTNIQHLILALFRHCGVLGNMIFFACSAWFLLDRGHASKKKILQLILDVWVISVTILVVVFILRRGNIGMKMIVKQILPITFENNWYITCYLLFYPLHPFLNWVIQKMEQKTLLRATMVLLMLYFGVNYVIPGYFFPSKLIMWVTIYFAMAYMKYYLAELSGSTKHNMLLLGIGLAGNLAMLLLTNFVQLRFGPQEEGILKWNVNCNPFLLLAAVSLLNMARNVRFTNKAVNYISGMSLFIYVFHENLLLRTFYRPLLWEYVYRRFGYAYVLVWALVLAAVVFLFGLLASILYKSTLQRAVTAVCHRLYPSVQKIYSKVSRVCRVML